MAETSVKKRSRDEEASGNGQEDCDGTQGLAAAMEMIEESEKAKAAASFFQADDPIIVQVRFFGREIPIFLSPESIILDLKSRLSSIIDVLTRCQMLTYKERGLIFNDTLIALKMMHEQFPKIEKVAQQPFILQSQLYSSIKDRTQVDRDLESLKKEKILRLFKLNTGQDDHAIMFFEDYINQMDIALKKSGSRSQHDIEVFEWFKIYVIEYKLDVSIDHQELLFLLSAGGEVKDEDITLLINVGVLTRQMIDPNMYWFAIPYIGSVLKGLSQGRKELLSFLNRRKYKEMLLAPLEKKRLRLSPLDMRFHLRDLIGSGHLKVLQTPSGMLVRVSKD